MLSTVTEVFRASRRADCEERAFMLTAVGVPNAIEFDGSEFVILVETEQALTARAHLQRYAAESRPPPPPPPPQRLYPYAWVGCVVYVLLLVGIGYAVAAGFWRLDAFDVGALDAGRVKAGEWWRVWTALTLHVDAAHLATNLGAGVWFGYLAGRQLGSGAAWLLAVIGAGLANSIEALLGPSWHQAVGASTAVFTVLGILAAFSWRERFSHPQRWARRWGPLIAGVLLLGWLGSGGDGTDALGRVQVASNVDVVGHVAGFVVGAVLGVAAALPLGRRLRARVPQWLAGVGAVAIIGTAWVFALMS